MFPGYSYGNARLRAKRSRLLTKAHYEFLLGKENIKEVITALTETPYKEDIEAALLRGNGVRCVLQALSANLARTLRHVREFFGGEPRQLVDLWLRRWDRHNLLTILRGQSQVVSAEAILTALVPVGQLDEVALRELARQPDVRAVIDLMTTWQLPYARALRQARSYPGPGLELDQLELALNRFHYTSLLEALSHGNGNRAIVLEHLQSEIDLVNLLTGLRLARRPDLIPLIQQRYHAADIRPLLIEPGGHLPVRRLAESVAGGLEALVRGLSDTRYGQALQAGWRRYQAGEGELTIFERELERWQAECAARLFSHHTLNIAIPIAYFSCKGVEVANLRLIAQAVALDLPREAVRRDLIIV